MLTQLDRGNIGAHAKAPGVAVISWRSGDRDQLGFDHWYTEAARSNPDVRFGQVDIDHHARLAAQWSIDEAPTVMVFRDGTLLFRHDGELDESGLTSLIRSAWAVDMEQVRKHVNGSQGRGRFGAAPAFAPPPAVTTGPVTGGAAGGAKPA